MRFLKEARGKGEAALDAARKPLARFEDCTGARDFKTFRREHAIGIKDRFGNPVVPHGWFLAPVLAIDEVVQRIQDHSIVQFEYDRETASLRKPARAE